MAANNARRISLGAQWRHRLSSSKQAEAQPPLPADLDQSRLAFYSGHLCERGTDTAMYDYADCAESVLGLTSYVFYDVDSPDNFEGCVEKFRARFGDRLIGVPAFDAVDALLVSNRIANLYLIKIVDDKNVSRAPGVRTLVHAVFFARRAHGDVYARISPCVPSGAAAEPQLAPMMLDSDQNQATPS